MAKQTQTKKAKSKRKRQAPSVTYSPELADKLLAKVAGGMSVKKICEQRGAPSRESFYQWLRRYPDFAENYERAIIDRADLLVEEILEIADNNENDFAENETEDGIKYSANSAKIARDRIKIDVRKWAAARMSPKRYGANLKAELDNRHSGEISVNIASFIADEAETSEDDEDQSTI